MSRSEECDDQDDDATDGCAACQVSCPEGWTESPANHCYRVVTASDDWASARGKCGPGHLATLGSEEERRFLRPLLQDDTWLGATDGEPLDSDELGTYAWVTGEPWWAPPEWGKKEPNVAERCGAVLCWGEYEHCLEMTPSGDWNDLFCDEDRDYACEWEPPGLAPGT